MIKRLNNHIKSLKNDDEICFEKLFSKENKKEMSEMIDMIDRWVKTRKPLSQDGKMECLIYLDNLKIILEHKWENII